MPETQNSRTPEGAPLSAHFPERVKRFTPRSPLCKTMRGAFFVGGLICAVGECLARLYLALGAETLTAYALVTVSMILLSAILTGVGIYDRVARFAGAGTLVPVTGFANAVVSPAIDNKSEGLIVGVGSKIFSVAGPVILYAVLAGSVYGVFCAVFPGV